MIFETEEAGIFHLLMGFLKEKGLFETLSSLQLETGQADEPLEENLLYLQRLILQGRLDDVILYIEPLEKVLQNKFQELLYVIHRQQFLEALCWHGGGGHRHAFLPWKPSKSADIDGEFEIDVIVKLLKSLELHCPTEEFNSLCSCLTLPKLSDNPDYGNWSVAEGRLETFQIIKNVINPYIHVNNSNRIRNDGSYNDTQYERKTGGFLSMLAMGLAYQVQNSSNTNKNESTATFTGNILSVKDFNGSLLGNEKFPFIEIKNPIEINSQFYDAKIYRTIIETKGEINCNRNNHVNLNDQNTDQYPSSDQGPLSVGRSLSDGQSNHEGGSQSRMRYGSNHGHGSDRNDRHNDQTHSSVIAINTKDISPRINEDDSSMKESPKISPVAWTINNNEDKNKKKMDDINMRKSTQKLDRYEGNHNESRGDSYHRENHSNRNDDFRINNRNNHATNDENNTYNSDKNYHNNDNNRDIHGNFNRNHNYNNNKNVIHNNSNDYKNHDDKHNNSDDINNDDHISSNTSNGQSSNSRYEKNSVNYNKHDYRNDNDNDRNYNNINANKRIHDSSNENDNYDINGNSNCNDNGSNSNVYANNDQNNAIMNRYSNMNTSNMNRDDIQSSNYNPESNKEGYKKELSPNIIFQTDCPVRCVRLLNNDNEYKQNKNDNDMNDRNGRSSSSKCAIGCNDKSLKILDISGYSNTRISGEVVKEYGDVHRGSIYAMDHYSSAKGVNLIATVSNDKAVKILNLNNGVMSAPMKGHTGTIRDVSFRKGSDDLLLLATAGAGDNKGRIWDVSTGSSYAVLSAHTDSIHGLAWLGDEDTAGLILTGDEKGLIIAHDLRSSRPAWMLNLSDNPGLSNRGGNSVCCMESVSSMLGGSQGQGQGHGNDVVVGCTGGYVSIIDPIQRTINHIHKAHNDDVRNISVYDSKKFNHNLNSNYFFNLVATSFDNICSIWEIDRNNMSYNMKLNYMLKGHTDKVLGVSTRLDNGVLDVITTGADGKVILWK